MHRLDTIQSRLAALALGLVLLGMPGMASAATLAYEPFDYPVESPLLNGTAATGDGFTSWTCGTTGWILPGLTYPGLPVASNAMRSPGGSRQLVGLAEPVSTGTIWISFLYKTSAGNSGANRNGVYFPNGGTGLFFGFGLNPYSATQGYLGLGSMNTVGTATQGATLLQQLSLGTYGATYLVVLKIDFDTSGANDTVTVYINPATNQPAPGVEPAGTPLTTFNVGTISGVGINVQGAGEITVDEFRVANSYPDAVDAVVVPPGVPAGLVATPGVNQVFLSWTAATGSPVSYNVKRSTASEGPYTTIATKTAPTTSHTDSIPGGTTYYYVVSAVNAIGESADTPPVSAAPYAPLPLEVGIEPGVGVTWFAGRNVTYQVQRASEDLGTETVWTNFGSPVTGDDSTVTVFDPQAAPGMVYQVISY